MAMFSRPARQAKRRFIVVVLALTILFPTLTFFFSFASDKTRAPPVQSVQLIEHGSELERRAVLPFRSLEVEGGRISYAGQIADPQRLEKPLPAGEVEEEDSDSAKQAKETEERSKAFERIFDTDFWGGGESRSGPGSRRDYTANARLLIAHALKEYGVHHMLDAPCGDVNWQPLIEGFNSTKYTGYDIVPQIIEKNTERFRDCPNVEFARVDFVNTPITINPDLIVCRDGIQHNSLKDGVRGFLNLQASGAKYLVTNWHTETGRGFVLDNAINLDIAFGGAYPINVFTHPFNFSVPDFFISEGVNGINADGKLVGVWRLPALGKGDGKRYQVPGPLMEKARREVVSKADVEEALVAGAAQ